MMERILNWLKSWFPKRCPICGGRATSIFHGNVCCCLNMACPNLFIGTLDEWNSQPKEEKEIT